MLSIASPACLGCCKDRGESRRAGIEQHGSAGGEPVQVAGAKLWQWRRQARLQAQQANVDPAEVDWLLRVSADVDALALRLGTLSQQRTVACRFSLTELEVKWQQRLKERVPVQHLAGYTPWRTLNLAVSPAVLVPRPETELMIDIVVDWLRQQPESLQLQQGPWVDMGTGSGAIALGLAQALPEASIHGVDLSAEAIEIATANARRNGLSTRVQFHQGSWFEPLTELRGRLAGMVSNPPYIPSAIVPTLAPEVARHEPLAALDGGADGLEAIRVLAAAAPTYLRTGGLWLVEMMQGQGPAVAQLLARQGCYQNIRCIHDLVGIERFVLAERQ